MAMRGTSHNGRVGKHGTYSAKHNDRNFDIANAEHIDQEKMSGNWYWHLYQTDHPEMSFEEVEAKFYEANFAKSLAAKNERYIQSGHKERIKTMDEYRANRLSCPEETILQVGKMGDTIDANLLKKICQEHVDWEQKTFPNVQILDLAMHIDEEGAPHVHERKVWIASSKDGLIVGQAKALEEMGIQKPHPKKKTNRYNNAKITYTAMCRDHFLETCKKHGLELENEPEKTSKRGLELEEYKRKQAQEKAEKARQDLKKVRLDLTEEQKKLEHRNKLLNLDFQSQLKTSMAKDAELRKINAKIAKAQAELDETMQKQTEQLDEIKRQIETANKQLQQVLDLKTEAAEIHIPLIPRRGDMQMYNKGAIEDVKSIGNKACSHLQRAQAMEINNREQAFRLDLREQDITKKEASARNMYNDATIRLRDIDNQIKQAAREMARALVKKELIPRRDELSDVMRDFMSDYRIDGKPMPEVFDDYLQADLDERADRYVRERIQERDDEWER